MKIYEYDNCVIAEDLTDFLPTHTFLCGQCFRWDEGKENESFIGIAHGKVIEVKYDDGKIIFKNTNLDDFENIWKNYFDLNNNYNLIKNSLKSDDKIKDAIDFGWGIRILNQDVFECLISFIISAQNGIPRIKKIVSNLSKMYGEKIIYNNEEYYTFPKPEILAKLTLEDLAPLKAGYRAKYILDAAKKVFEGEVDIYSLENLSTNEAREQLLKIKGVGPKVADCVLLFSLKKHDSFPIDVWIGRIMKGLYLNSDSTLKEISKYSYDKFGEYGGFAQQYLFYYARENKLFLG